MLKNVSVFDESFSRVLNSVEESGKVLKIVEEC